MLPPNCISVSKSGSGIMPILTAAALNLREGDRVQFAVDATNNKVAVAKSEQGLKLCLGKGAKSFSFSAQTLIKQGMKTGLYELNGESITMANHKMVVFTKKE